MTLLHVFCLGLIFHQNRFSCDELSSTAFVHFTVWQILHKVALESFFWGLGTAIGELPPYFVARAGKVLKNYLALEGRVEDGSCKDRDREWGGGGVGKGLGKKVFCRLVGLFATCSPIMPVLDLISSRGLLNPNFTQMK